MASSLPRRVALLGFKDAQIPDVPGPSEVFSIAERLAPGSYAVELISLDRGEIRTSAGCGSLLTVPPRVAGAPIDTLRERCRPRTHISVTGAPSPRPVIKSAGPTSATPISANPTTERQ